MRLNYKLLYFLNISLLVGSSLLSYPIFAQEINEKLQDEELKELEEIQREMFSEESCRNNATAFEQLPPEISRRFKDYCDAVKKGQVPKNVNLLDLLTGGNNSQGLEGYHQALEDARRTGNLLKQRQILSSIAMGYENKRQFAKSLDFYQQTLTVAKKINDKQVEAETLNSIARLYARRGQNEQSIEYLERSLAITKEEWGVSKQRLGLRLDTLNLMGFIYQYQAQNNKALQAYENALAIAKSEVIDQLSQATTIREFGRFYQKKGEYNKALDLYQQLLPIAKKDDYIKLLFLKSLGDLYEVQKNYPKALEFYEQAVALAKQDNLSLYLGSSLADVGRTYNYLNQYTAAEQVLKKAIDIGGSQYKLTHEDLDEQGSNILINLTNSVEQFIPLLYETEKNGYQELQRALIAQNKTKAALEISEKSRARAFAQLLRLKLAASGKAVSAESAETITIEQMQRIAKERKATLVQYSILKKPIQNGVLEYGMDIPNPQAQEDLQLLIWVIKPNGEIAFRQVDLKSINNSVEALVKNSRNSILRMTVGKKSAGALKKLHQLLIDPIANDLPTDSNAHVIFIPDDSLFLVPFVALQDAQGKYLIEKHTILTAPAIRVLDLVRQQRQKVAGKGALVVGNPTMPYYAEQLGETPQQLSALPNAELEAQAIAKLLNTQPIIGKEATKAAIVQQMPSARIIHLATHGLLDHYEGLGSAIALAPSAKDDGFLTAQELVEMKLNAELVVLSACDTGRGVITGDGVIGLSRSLFAAGVPSIVVSLWAVPDAPTSVLMMEYYQRLKTQPDKAQALRQAMLVTIKKHPSPQDWAAFTLIGEAF